MLERGNLLLQASDLVKRYGSLEAVNNVSLAVQRGEIVGLLGPNGAGKTTTVNMCVGLLRPTAGQVLIDGINVDQDPRAAKRLIGFLPDEPYLYDKLTGREFVTFMADLYGTTLDLANRRERLLAYFGLLDSADDLIAGYSHGMKQKAALCGVLIHEPQILLLDEPTVGLDPRSARLLKDTLRSLADAGRGIVLSTHILEIAQAICDRIAILDHGRIIAEGTMSELRQSVHASSGESLEDIFLQLTAEGEEGAVAQALLEV
ncbi:MAG: ABC transporter ATP-binding protein [Chloroflexota bacterium]